jgi:polysaccharide pyruvyl transferase WcaK-like protein
MSFATTLKQWIWGTMTKKQTIVLLNDSRDQESFGSQVLADTLVQLISDELPQHTLRSIPSHWLVDHPAGAAPFVSGIALHIPQAAWPEVADQFETIADDWLSGHAGSGVKEYLVKLKNADLIMLNGEGSVYRSNVSAIRELFLLWFAKTRLGIPAMFVNGTVHLTDIMPVLPAMVRKAFSALDGIALREPFSYRNVLAYVPDVSARMIPDAAWIMNREAEAVRSLSPGLPELPTGDFFLFDPGGMIRDFRFPKRSALVELLRALRELGPKPVVIVKQPPYDDFLIELARMNGVPVFGRGHTYRQFMALQSRAQFQVTSRYHDLILGTIMGCPSVPLASGSHKIHGACELLDGLAGMPFDGTDLRNCTPEIVQCARSYLERLPTLRSQFAAAATRLAAQALEVGTMVRQVLDSHSSVAVRQTGAETHVRLPKINRPSGE